MLLLCAVGRLPPTTNKICLCVKVLTAQTSHTRHLSEAAQLRQELRQLSGRLQLAESDQQHLEAACKQTTATAEAEWATKVHGCIAHFTFSQLSDCVCVGGGGGGASHVGTALLMLRMQLHHIHRCISW